MNCKPIVSFIKKHNDLLANFSYITILQVFVLLAPLITYPYLVRVLGKELYGVVLTAQMLASYATLIIDFGSNSVCAKHVSINRSDKNMLSEIVCSVLCVRGVLFIICFVIYIAIIALIPNFREYFMLFTLTYGLTLNDLLFPQYFFQGIEKMGVITAISITTKIIFISFVFFAVKSQTDYLFVPILYTIGYSIGGLISLYIVFCKYEINFFLPSFGTMMNYVKDSSAIFATELICTIKDKFNYMLVGSCAGMENVVSYDLGLKLNSLVSKPLTIISTVLFPRFAKNRNTKKLKTAIYLSCLIAIVLVILVNIFLDKISFFFLHESIDLVPLRLFLFAPIMLSVSSMISSNLFVAFGFNKYVLYSIVITTIAYVFSLIFLFFTNSLNSIYSFIYLALISYFTEFLYRVYTARKLFKKIK
ncbi:oligosaccharide flippase family protein [Butyricimonas synergistica]|uniref:oligosaccharide flippase family protein n=1 Tax=Butyricimonas synergistica TaxID=544644 RepID=UPI000369DD22|nr:oligosaccharide flippase family protein [Butyricimonas synergistica]